MRDKPNLSVPLMQVRGLDKSFYATHAAIDVSFDVNRGEIVALLGENGAGKSTVIKMIAGVYTPDSGEVLVDGVRASLGGRNLDIAFVHQTLGLIEWMTVAENIAQIIGFPRRFGIISKSALNKQALEVLEIVGWRIDPEARIFNLSRTDRSLLAIARALIQKPKVLVLDEPTASLPAHDVAQLFGVLRDLQASGVGIIYVSHRLDEVHEISSRAVIMRNGAVVADRDTSTLSKPELVNLIVGKQPLDVEFESPKENIRLSLKDFSAAGVGPVDIDVFEGEVIALCGLRGAGQDEIGRAIAGVIQSRIGSLRIEGTQVEYRSVAEAVKEGVGFSTSNRETEAVAPGMTVRENLFLNPALWGRKALNFKGIKGEVQKAYLLLDKFGVRPRNPELSLDTLSGGNQQKVLLARWFGLNFKIMVLEEPTMGVDIGAKADIYGLFRNVAQNGASLVIVSTDMEEVVRVANRAIVFLEGRVVAVLEKADLTFNNLISLASNLGAHTQSGGINE